MYVHTPPTRGRQLTSWITLCSTLLASRYLQHPRFILWWELLMVNKVAFPSQQSYDFCVIFFCCWPRCCPQGKSDSQIILPDTARLIQWFFAAPNLRLHWLRPPQMAPFFHTTVIRFTSSLYVTETASTVIRISFPPLTCFVALRFKSYCSDAYLNFLRKK